jgi:hypothetical protein
LKYFEPEITKAFAVYQETLKEQEATKRLKQKTQEYNAKRVQRQKEMSELETQALPRTFAEAVKNVTFTEAAKNANVTLCNDTEGKIHETKE